MRGRGVDFLSFAVPTITGEVLRHLRDRSTAIRVPRRLRHLQALICDTAADLGQRLGRAPRPSEIAAELRMDLDVMHVSRLLSRTLRTLRAGLAAG
jgi:RNA polymerase sigma-B factor